MTFLISCAALLLYMTLWFWAGYRRKRLDTVDTAWGGGFLVVATIALIQRTNSHTLLVWLIVLVWSSRLAWHIWRRAALKGPDPRYEELSVKWSRQHFWLRAYVAIFITQATLIAVVSLPVAVIGSEATRPLGWFSAAAAAVWAIGFLIEAVADRQLKTFLIRKQGAVMHSGLWKYSRHPNYFGELLQWWAISLLALGPSIGWIGLIGPAVLSYLIIFVSGIPPIEKRRAHHAGYQAYKRVTSPLIPLPPRAR